MTDRDLARLKAAKRDYKATFKNLQTWRRIKPRELDLHFEKAHDEVFAKRECLECANCCKTTSPIFRDVDINRLARHLRLKPGAFTQQYLKLDEDQDYVLKSSPCAFLGDDNYCSVYEHRPQACREYPHTNRKRMFKIMDLTADNTLICPAVNDIVEKIREVLQQGVAPKR